MFTKVELEKVISDNIIKDENLGERAGGSGHLSSVSYKIERFSSEEIENGKWKIDFTYSLITESEFTYYPDNPPYTTYFKNTIIINSETEITEDGGKKEDSEFLEIQWEKATEEINNYLVNLLHKIEWKYGDNRAPIKFPPIFEINLLDPFNQFVCKIEADLTDNEEYYSFTANTPQYLIDKIKFELPDILNIG